MTAITVEGRQQNVPATIEEPSGVYFYGKGRPLSPHPSRGLGEDVPRQSSSRCKFLPQVGEDLCWIGVGATTITTSVVENMPRDRSSLAETFSHRVRERLRRGH